MTCYAYVTWDRVVLHATAALPKGKESAVHIRWNQKPTRSQHLKFEQEMSYINLVGTTLLRNNPDGCKRN